LIRSGKKEVEGKACESMIGRQNTIDLKLEKGAKIPSKKGSIIRQGIPLTLM
jgi:hypothetical protein